MRNAPKRQQAANLHLHVATSGQISRLLHIGGGVGVMGKQEEKEEVVGDQVGVGGHLLPRLPDPPTIWSPPSHHIQELPVTPGSHNRSPILASHWCGNNPPMSLCSSKRLSCCSKEKGRWSCNQSHPAKARCQFSIHKGLGGRNENIFQCCHKFLHNWHFGCGSHLLCGVSAAYTATLLTLQTLLTLLTLLTLQHCLH